MIARLSGFCEDVRELFGSRAKAHCERVVVKILSQIELVGQDVAKFCVLEGLTFEDVDGRFVVLVNMNVKVVSESSLVERKVEDLSVETIEGLNNPVSHAEGDVLCFSGRVR